MPELPEVETVVRTLEHQLGKRTIKSVDVLWANIIANKTIDDFCKLLENQRFEKYDRRGKFLVFTLTDYVLIAHLRMEGKFYVYKEAIEPLKHTHVIFNLDEGQLHYNDVRKFGRFYLYRKGEQLECLKSLGKEPWDDGLTADYCKAYSKNNKTPIKSMLLDQGMICGIGNIYADEICFESKLNPFTPAMFVSKEKWEEIIETTRMILSDAIKAGGTTIRSYTSSFGVTGLFQLSLKVHARNGCCYECGSEIVKTRIGGRGTYYCPVCQKRSPVSIAITGTIGSGKSAVTKLLAKKGLKTISCDDINSKLLNKEETIADLAAVFDCEADIVNRNYISDKIFNDAKLKKQVEEYLHRKIYKEICDFIRENENENLIIIEVPLLFEVAWDKYFDYNVVVTASKETVYQRLKEKRGMSEQQIAERFDKQMSAEEKMERADYILHNDSSLTELKNKTDKLLAFINRMLGQKEK